ncbi:MAG: T9SS C-terminal target domain-containing protein [Cytophagales bacterium]|nr:MAG: T9SS C-terminal target domain-containing protein [Cytophagales bacterium]TAF59565.1 MAG: T9SS C-terminal target domain-containing protein [Cytophagales bacterium]
MPFSKLLFVCWLMTFLMLEHVSCAQPATLENIQRLSLSLTDASRGNRRVGVEVFYPSKTTDGKIIPLEANMPLLVLGHGFVMSVDAYENFAKVLCPLGYVLALPTTEGSLSPSHANFGKDLLWVGKTLMERAKSDSRFELYGFLGNKSAVMGHSMGGGAAFLAAAEQTFFTTMVSFAPAETTPSAITAARRIKIPFLIFAGENDGVTPPEQHQIPLYEALQACGYLLTIKGGGHCFFANDNFACSFGEASSTPKPIISRQKQQDLMFVRLIPWLDYQLKGREAALKLFQDSLRTNEVQNQYKCPIVDPDPDEGDSTVTGFETNFEAVGGRFSPNPAQDFLELHFAESMQSIHFSAKLFDTSGQMLNSSDLDLRTIEAKRWRVSTSHLPNGLYYLKLESKENSFCIKFIVQK